MSGAFCLVLDRTVNATDRAFWAGELSANPSLPRLMARLAATTEYYDDAQP